MGNVVAAVLGFAVGLLVAHKVYNLRRIHQAIRHHIRSGQTADGERDRA
jgi:hypothetical protein